MAAIYIKDGATLTPASVDNIGISNDDTNYDLIPKAGLKVGGFFSGTPETNYPYNTKTILTFESANINPIYIELQNVVNEVAWAAGTQAALATAKATIGGWLP